MNKNQQDAKKNKNDEFYTQLPDIENELKHYKEHFKNKIVLCNCDDPETSNFWLYFKGQFKNLSLKKLIGTYYDKNNQPTYQIITEQGYGYEPTKTIMKGNGDFRNDENIELLKEADIVVTNPPFSLFREYVAQLMEYNKNFLIIGNVNSISLKEIFNFFKENKIWLGVSISSGDREFMIPNHYNIFSNTLRIDEKGDRFVKVTGVRWFTNLSHKKRNEELILYKEYDKEYYPKYDNYDAINVDKVKEIPKDYNGVIGVPISFMDKYNPNQFEIIRFRKGNDNKDLSLNGKFPYARILIQRKK